MKKHHKHNKDTNVHSDNDAIVMQVSKDYIVNKSEEELAEQKKLYAIYLAAIRGQVTDLLESIEFVDGGKNK